MTLQKAFKKIDSNPRILFLVDGLGAILSAFMLGVVWVRWENIFGIPPTSLYLLALLPCLFAGYDFYCYQKKSGNVGAYLQGIGFLNLAYCVLSMGLAIYHYEQLTYFGWIYILIEIVIVVLLSLLEINTGLRNKEDNY